MAKRWSVILLCAFVSACGDQRIINRIELVETVSFDNAGDGIKSSILVDRYKERARAEVKLITTLSNSSYDIIPRLNTKSNNTVEVGQLGMILFGKRYSEGGIGSQIESLNRDPKISSRLQFGVADRDATETMKLIEKCQSPFYLSEMVEQNIKNGNLPAMNLHVHLFNYYGEGRDLFLPYFVVERGEVKIDGLALFRDDRMITVIGIRDAFLFKILHRNSKNGSHLVPLDGRFSEQKHQAFVLLRNVHSSAKYGLVRTSPDPSISIRLKLEAEVQDAPDSIHLNSEKHLARLEETISTYFQEEIERLISVCQANRVDPIGFGDFLRSRSKTWSPQAFDKIYPTLRTTVSVDFKIVQHGIGE